MEPAPTSTTPPPYGAPITLDAAKRVMAAAEAEVLQETIAAGGMGLRLLSVSRSNRSSGAERTGRAIRRAMIRHFRARGDPCCGSTKMDPRVRGGDDAEWVGYDAVPMWGAGSDSRARQ